MTEKSELKKLEERISYLASGLDAAIDDYFAYDNSNETAETAELHRKLNIAWDYMDAALDNIKCLTNGVTKTGKQQGPAGTDPGEPAPYIDRETFKELLQKVTPESLQAANTAAVFFREQLENDEEGLKLSTELQAAFLSVMLFSYGKLVGKYETDKRAQAAKHLMDLHRKWGLDAAMINPEPGQAADPEEKEDDLTW